MKKGQNFNHPKRGSQTKVEPIRDLKDIAAIKKLLSDSPLYSALFIVGINTNLRASDLLNIRAGQVQGLKAMDEIDIREKKTQKTRRISLNKNCIEAINKLFASKAYSTEEYLFLSQRGRLTVPSLHRLVKSWCAMINLKGKYGSHTLRKTWGYMQRVQFGTGLPELMTCFNHSTQRQTLDYLCIQPEEVKNVYANVL